MKVTQGQFSFLPDLNETEIRMQVQYALDPGLGGRDRIHQGSAPA